ncbi:MAG: WbqC family protein [Bacteroidia bacterium]
MNIYPICYFPPVPWFVAARRESVVRLEVCQHFRKQQYTNRAFIRVPNRVFPLTIPVERRGDKVAIRDKKISYAENWPDNHWRTIQNAYKHAPYFAYYESEIRNFYSRKPLFLPDLLTDSLHLSFKMTGLEIPFEFTEAYHPPETYHHDYRQAFDPGLHTLPPWFTAIPYVQLFEGFVPGLSILDLALNLGPESRLLLDRSYLAAGENPEGSKIP